MSDSKLQPEVQFEGMVKDRNGVLGRLHLLNSLLTVHLILGYFRSTLPL